MLDDELSLALAALPERAATVSRLPGMPDWISSFWATFVPAYTHRTFKLSAEGFQVGFHITYGQTRLLIVQNDPDICDVLRNMCRSEEYIVDVEGNGKDAVQYVSGVSYGAILLHMRLPDHDSLSLLELL